MIRSTPTAWEHARKRAVVQHPMVDERSGGMQRGEDLSACARTSCISFIERVSGRSAVHGEATSINPSRGRGSPRANCTAMPTTGTATGSA